MKFNNKCNNIDSSVEYDYSFARSFRRASVSVYYFVFMLLLILLFPFYACSNEFSDEQEINDKKVCIMIVPDIQNYTDTDNRFVYLDSIAGYYCANKNSIDVVMQVGDLTNNNLVWQYENAYEHLFSKFDDSDQLVFCLGNHDYGNNGRSDIRMSNFPDFMMPPYDIRMKESKWDNYVRYIELGGIKYGILVLEFCTRNDVLIWANDVISADNETPFIILTHTFLDQNGEMFDAANPDIVNKGSSHQRRTQHPCRKQAPARRRCPFCKARRSLCRSRPPHRCGRSYPAARRSSCPSGRPHSRCRCPLSR